MTPAPKKPTQDELAKALNLSTRRVRQLISDGMPDSSLESALAWRKAESQGDSSEQLRKARILLVNAQRERVELETAKISGLHVPVGDMREAHARIGSILRARMLKIPHDLPPMLEGLTASKMQGVLKTEIYAALNEFCDAMDELATA